MSAVTPTPPALFFLSVRPPLTPSLSPYPSTAYLKYSAEHYVRVKNNYLAGSPAAPLPEPAASKGQGTPG